MSDNLLDKEALRLLKAFMNIKSAEARKLIIALTEAAARGATVKIESQPPAQSELGKDRRSLN